MTPTDREMKRLNRVAKEKARFAGNRSWQHPGVVTETRQQVRAEGRRLEASILKREADKEKLAKQRNKPRRTASMVERLEAYKSAVAYLPRHDFGLNGADRKAVRRARQEARKQAQKPLVFGVYA